MADHETERVFLLPGEYHVTRTPCQIATLLGSCVSVCLSHETQAFAAMNHYLLAENSKDDPDKGRYGDTAIEALLGILSKYEPNMGRFKARLYGGAAVVSGLTGAGGTDIGRHNIEMARRILRGRGIPVAEEDVGGTSGRRIYFDTALRQVTVKTILKAGEGGASALAADLAAKRKDIASRKTRVLVVDDSPLVRKLLVQAIEGTQDLEVCGEAGDAFEARDLIVQREPDVISLDIIMPKLDGLKFLKALMRHYPKPVVICSTIAKDASQVALKAKEYGAVDVVDKDTLKLYQGMETVRAAYIPKIRNAAVKVVRKLQFND